MPLPEEQDFRLSEIYSPRAVRFIERVEFDRWALKLYAISYGDQAMDAQDFHEAVALARWVLPRPARTAQRPGLGFLIAHRGRDVDYFVINWWDRENELFNRVLMREQRAGADWRAGTAGELACVWDLEILWFERNAYIAHMLDGAPDEEAYLATVMPAADGSSLPA